jgi:phosphohistidine phosphatase
MRHGEAESIKPGLKDSERKLTSAGVEHLDKMFQAIKKTIPQFDYLLSSPLIRAVQTTERVKLISQSKSEILIEEKLRPGEELKVLIHLLNSLGGKNIFICGHEPDISEFCSSLISTNYSALLFKPGTIAKISFEGKVREASGILQFLFNPLLFK